jgi:hypothetical protein
MRDIFPLPFRTACLDLTWLAWNDGTVRRLAIAIYEGRCLPAGTLDTGRLAVLADALEEAGCANEEIWDTFVGLGRTFVAAGPSTSCSARAEQEDSP